MTGRIAPLNEIHTVKAAKIVLPPIDRNRVPSIESAKASSRKEEIVVSEIPVKDFDQQSNVSECFSNSSEAFKSPSLPSPIEIIQNEAKPELTFVKLKQMHRISFPKTSRKLLLPDEAERPIIDGNNSSFSKIAAPYIQIIKEEGVLSMGLVDPLISTPKVDDRLIYIPLSKILKDKPINRISIQEKFPLLNPSQLSTLLLYLARIGDADSVKYLCRTAMVNINIVDDSGRTPLVYAAVGGHTDTMTILLKSGAIVDAIDHGGRTALFHASYYSLPEAIKVLLKYGADITHRDFYGKTVLHYSVFSDRVESTKILLSALRRLRILSWFKSKKWEFLVESFDESGMTPMMIAAYLGNLGHLKAMMFMNYKSCKVKTRNGFSCIHFCANNYHLRVSKYLLRVDRSLADDAIDTGCRPIHLAARNGNYPLLEYLVTIDKNLVNVVDLNNRTPLHYASAFGHLGAIRILIQNGADVDFKDNNGATALHYAAIYNYFDCVQMLIKNDAIIEINDNNGRSSLMWAFMQGHLDIAKFLMPLVNKQNHISDASRNTPLHISSLIGHLDACIYLLQNGVDIDAKNDQGMTPLFQSIIMGWLTITEELIDYGANISEQDNFGRTPLHWAIMSYSNESIQILLDNPDCMISIPDYGGREPIHEAATSGNDELIKILIQMGCDPSCTDDNGLTPLHLSCSRGNVVCCKVLIENTVPFNALDFSDDRRTPLDIAYDEQKQECVDLLREIGCLTGGEIRDLAARAIQFLWNNYKVKKSTRESPAYRNLQNSRNKLRKKAATKIQAWFRGKVQQKKYKLKLEISRINDEREKELNAALNALAEAKKNRAAAEVELKHAAEELQIAKNDKKKNASRCKPTVVRSRSKRRIRNSTINNAAASIIQKCWRNHKSKRNGIKKAANTEKSATIFSSSEEIRVEINSDHSINNLLIKEGERPKVPNRDATLGKSLFRQNTGSKLNTLPKPSNASQSKESPLPQNFESGYFNKVFKSTVAISSKEKEVPIIRQENPKKSDLMGLIPPTRGDRSIGKSMEIAEKMVGNRSKRLSFDHGDCTRNAREGDPVSMQPSVDAMTQSLRRTLQRSNSSVSSSGQIIGASFMDSIPKGYDDLHFHSIVRGNSMKK